MLDPAPGGRLHTASEAGQFRSTAGGRPVIFPVEESAPISVEVLRGPVLANHLKIAAFSILHPITVPHDDPLAYN